MAIDWTYYYTQVLKNPTATPEAKARAMAYLGVGAETAPMASPPSNIRELQVGEGNQEALSLQGSSMANSASQKFGLALMQMLKQYQNPNLLGTRAIQQQQLDLSTQQAGRISAQTPEALIGASPSQQSRARSAEASALSPSIEGAGDRAKTFSEQLAGFGDALTRAQAIGEWMASQEENTRKEKQNIVLSYPESIKAMPEKERTQYLKEAGISESFLDSLIKGAGKEWVDETVNGIFGQRNTKTGEFNSIKDLSTPGGTAPNSYKEWELAGGLEGTEKSYADWLKQAKTPELSSTQKLKLTAYQDILSRTEKIKNKFNELLKAGIQIGPVAALDAAIKRAGGNENQIRAELYSLTEELKDSILRARSGAQINEQEYKRLAEFIPNISQQEQMFEINLNRLSTETQDAMYNLTQGIDVGGMPEEGKKATYSILAPDNKTYYFPSQEALDAFKKEVGL